MNSFTVLSLFSGVCFIFYGFSCLFSAQMKKEFIRFKIPQFRFLTGVLQVAGGTSLLIGFYYSNILAFCAALGLSLLMFLGFLLRIYIKDSLLLSAPAFLFSLLNAYLAYKFILIF